MIPFKNGIEVKEHKENEKPDKERTKEGINDILVTIFFFSTEENIQQNSMKLKKKM